MKKKVLLSLVLILLGSLTMTLCKVQAVEAADLEKLQKLEIVTSAGEYKTGDTITFRATFENDIAGITTTGSLKISFSESKIDREIFHGTSVNNTITYQYTIQEKDKGTLTFKMYSIKALTESNGSVKTDKFDNDVVINVNVAATPSVTPTPEPSATPSPEPSTTPNPTEDFTDFSKVEISLTRESDIYTHIQIKNVSLKKDHNYYVKIGANKQIDITSENSDSALNEYKDEGICRTTAPINKYMELNQDIYVSVLERYVENGEIKSKIVIDGQKLEKLNEPKFANAFFATFMSHSGTQIVTNFNHDRSAERKMQIKVGKVTDIEILKKIKNKDANGFTELLSYAKKTQGLFDKNVDCDANDGRIGYSSYKDGKSILDVSGLTQGEYYFLYIKTDDENGKYTSNEAVTLAQADVYPDQDNAWYLFFYGEDKFKWADWKENNGSKDDTLAPDKIIPQTGSKSLIGATIVLTICVGGVLTYVGYRKNNYK